MQWCIIEKSEIVTIIIYHNIARNLLVIEVSSVSPWVPPPRES